jgi:uncharacterized protein YbbK (DUF523 family)
VILVSACLAGLTTRFDGRVLPAHPAVAELDPARVLALCPEVAGGLSTPRPPARFVGARPGREGADVLAGRARLIDAAGRDVSAAFIAGAEKVLAAAQAAGAAEAWLKDRSPSCAHDPAGANPQTGPAGPRQGVLTALLLAQGFKVVEMRLSVSSPVLGPPLAR